MSTSELLGQGRLAEALATLQEQVKREPGEVRHRTYLFQLLAVLGQWPRSLAQLETVGSLDASTAPMVETYRRLLAEEEARRGVFAGQGAPTIIGEPAAWMAWLAEAVRHDASGNRAEANRLRLVALEAAPALEGALDGEPFDWIADADTRLGPMLEVVLNGHYAWLPFQHIRSIHFEAPADLRDLVWFPAMVTLVSGGELPAFIPTRYPGSEACDRAEIRLARKTEWARLAEDSELWSGLGQRMLMTPSGEKPLLEVRELTFSAPAQGAANE